MRRMIKGKVYDTETATLLSESACRYIRNGRRLMGVDYLFRGPNGAHFLVVAEFRGENESTLELSLDKALSVTFTPLTLDGAAQAVLANKAKADIW